MDKIRLGVVGPGRIWKRAHKPALDLLEDRIEIAAFCASSEASRREVAQTYPDVPFYFDYHDLVTSPEIDWVLVLTPISLNAPVALAAMKAGKNVFLEKPMARSLTEGKRLMRTADETGRHLYVLEQAVYPDYLETVEEVIHSGEIGEIIMYDLVSHRIFDTTAEDEGHGSTLWRVHADFPLGTLFDGGHHPMARLSRLFGRPASIYASGRQVRPTHGEFDHVLMLFEYDSGVRGSFSHGAVLNRHRNHFYIRGTQGILSIERERLVIDYNDDSQRVIERPPERAHEAMWRALVDAVAEGHEPYYTKERAFQELSILLAIQRSIREHGRVRV
ncbi:MAG: Gfo/Idh/MocA family protein [Anaerolineales bacterium]